MRSPWASSSSPGLRRLPRPGCRLHRISSRPISGPKWWSCRRLPTQRMVTTSWAGRRLATAVARCKACRPPLLAKGVLTGPWPSDGECVAGASVACRPHIALLTATVRSGAYPAAAWATASATVGGISRPATSAPGSLQPVRTGHWTSRPALVLSALGRRLPVRGVLWTAHGLPLPRLVRCARTRVFLTRRR